jgi:iron complex outermembrane receptor protein
VPSWSLELDETFTEFTPRIILEYQVVENTMIWGSVSKGYQAGGFQTLCFGNLACSQNVYDPETVTSSELGVKSDFLDGTIRINASTWYAQYSDIQQTVVTGASFPLVNAGDVDVLGLDVEAYWSPNEQFNAFLIVGLADEEIDDSTSQLIQSERLPGLPKSTVRLGADWHTPLAFASTWNLIIGADIEYSDDYLAALAADPDDQLIVPSFTRWNGFIGVDQPDGNWSVVLRGRNLSDSEDYISGIVAPGLTNIRTVSPPREYMLEAKYRY